MTTEDFVLPGIEQSSCRVPNILTREFDPRDIQASEELLSLMSPPEGMALYEYARRARGSILEIGTYCGFSALFLAYGIRNRPAVFQRNAQLFTIDMHIGLCSRDAHHEDMASLKKRGHPCTFDRYVTNCKKHNVWDIVYPIIDDAAYAYQHWKHGSISFLFIDGDHMQALRDFENYAHLLTTESIVCFHDYSPDIPKIMEDVDLLVSTKIIDPIERIKKLFFARYSGTRYETFLSK